MSRYYAMGIIIVILFLNIPEVRNDAESKVRFYKPSIAQQIQYTKDRTEPALLALMKEVQSRAQYITKNGITTINYKQIADVDTSDTWNLDHMPSISDQQFDSILREYNSPATGIGAYVTTYAASKRIDNAYPLYMFIHESTAGTASNWNAETHNVGNIICAGYSSCIGNFRAYDSWEEGFKATIDLLAYYRDELGITTIDRAIEKWAPPVENDTPRYISSLHENVRKWRNVLEFVATTKESGIFTVSLPADVTSDTNAESILTLGGCLADTVPNALLPSKGLQTFSIQPGDDWSFNEQWVIIDANNHWCGSVPYGGICDMATRYNIAAQTIGLETIYGMHPGGLYGVDTAKSVVIWSSGVRGGQDLVIKNTTSKTAHFNASIAEGVFKVQAWLQ